MTGFYGRWLVVIHGYRDGFAYITFTEGPNKGYSSKVPAGWVTKNG